MIWVVLSPECVAISGFFSWHGNFFTFGLLVYFLNFTSTGWYPIAGVLFLLLQGLCSYEALPKDLTGSGETPTCAVRWDSKPRRCGICTEAKRVIAGSSRTFFCDCKSALQERITLYCFPSIRASSMQLNKTVTIVPRVRTSDCHQQKQSSNCHFILWVDNSLLLHVVYNRTSCISSPHFI